jgi:hypothetical protein
MYEVVRGRVGRLFVAAPHREPHSARVWVYKVTRAYEKPGAELPAPLA